MKKLFTKKQIVSAIKITVLSAILIVGLNYANAAWSGPTATAPDGNTPAPVNIGTLSQIKNGGLGLNALSVFGDGLFTGKATANRFCFANGSCISSWPEACEVIESTPLSPIVILSASPTNVAYNGSTVLTWSSTNATSCSANWTSSTAIGGIETKSNLTSTTTYTIICTGANGSANNSIVVTVGSQPAPAPTVSLTASPSTVDYNTQTMLTWSSTNATSCSANWTSSTATSGTQAVSFTGTTGNNLSFQMSCTGAGGTETASTLVYCKQRTFYKDADSDSYPVNQSVTGCYPPAGYVRPTVLTPSGDRVYANEPPYFYPIQWDCDDSNANLQREVVGGGYLDKDGDGYAPDNSTKLTCVSNIDYPKLVLKLGDCNDNNKDVRPGAPYSGVRDSVVGWDYDCDGKVTKRYDSTVWIAENWLSYPPGYYSAYKPYGMCEYTKAFISNFGYNPKNIDVSAVSCGDSLSLKPIIPDSSYTPAPYDEAYCENHLCAYIDKECTKVGWTNISWVKQICK